MEEVICVTVSYGSSHQCTAYNGSPQQYYLMFKFGSIGVSLIYFLSPWKVFYNKKFKHFRVSV